MNNDELRSRVGLNIARLRRERGLTQAELAERINYSDKAVSKWERGESCPDVPTVMAIADKLGVTVNELLSDPNELPANSSSRVEKTMEKVVEKALKRKANKKTILCLSSLLVWFVALFIYVVISSIGLSRSWLAFFYAIPADCIVMLSLRSAWHDFRWNRALISGIMWGALVSIFATLLVIWNINVWKIFLLGIPGQAAILLWFKLFRPVAEDAQ